MSTFMDDLTREALFDLLVHARFSRDGHQLEIKKSPGVRKVHWTRPSGNQEFRPVSDIMAVLSNLGFELQCGPTSGNKGDA